MPKRVKKSHDVFYVGVRDPVDVRRSILEGAREAIHFLKRYEKLKAIRSEKTQTILTLDTEVKELRNLVTKLRKSFPAAKLRMNFPLRKPKCVVCSKTYKTQKQLSAHMRHHEPKKKEKKKEVIKNPVILERRKADGTPIVKDSRDLSDLEKLEHELADIEGKLDTLA
jgi:hypothetical protein